MVVAEPQVITRRMALQEMAKRKVRENFGSMFRASLPQTPYYFGAHTKVIIDELDKTTKRLEAGKNRYLIINVPPRHGKSDLVSRRYSVWHMGRNPDHEVILASYNYQLATDMAYDARAVFRDKIGPLFGLSIARDRMSIDRWRIMGHRGVMYSAGMTGGTITGRGGHLIIIDDYLKRREDAESELMRDKVWHSFQNDIMTRLAPAHAVVIVANRWHVDDLVGRILDRNDPESNKYDPDFPVFELLKFPAQADNGTWLFPERFNDAWYKAARAFYGSYAWSSMGLQEPSQRMGNRFRVDQVSIDDDMPKDLDWHRGWDLSSTKKEREKDDPDYTVGTRAAFKDGHIYVDDVVRGQWEAPERMRKELETAKFDGMDVTVHVESVAGYKDAYTDLRARLEGFAIVRKFLCGASDKGARAAYLEPIFEAGRVHIRRAGWNKAWINEFRAFPSGRHDDEVDSLVVATKEEADSPWSPNITFL